jgi:subtilase family serine protease
MSGRRIGAVAVPAALALVALAGAVPTMRSRTAAARDLRPTPSSTMVTFALSLRLDEWRLRHDLATGKTVSSAAALGKRYGLSRADERHVERILRANGIAVTREYPQRSQLDAQANIRTLARFFHVAFRDHPGSTGSHFLAPAGDPKIPSSLRPYVTGVVGLDTRPLALSADLPHGALRPPDAGIAYDVTPLHQVGIDGTGQAIAVVSLEAFPPDYPKTQSDVSTFRSSFAAKGPEPVDVKVDGGGTSSDLSEDDLDLDVVSAIAPGAQILNYEAPKTSAGLVDVFSRVISDGRVKIASFSWGICDETMPASVRKNIETALKLAVLRGITVFVSSGDSGAYDCQRSKFADHRLTVDFPSDSPQVVSVGGTLLSVLTSGAYGTESGWEGPFSNSGGGGGIDSFDAAPSWQTAAHVGNGNRVVPDVSASASPTSGWLTRDYGNWDSFGGTSAAAPFWASSMLLAEQLAAKQGVTRTCFLAPILYELASARQPYPPFHDVRTGGNRHYDAGPGWDYATGLGSPDVYNLARDLVAYLRTHPCEPSS